MASIEQDKTKTADDIQDSDPPTKESTTDTKIDVVDTDDAKEEEQPTSETKAADDEEEEEIVYSDDDDDFPEFDGGAPRGPISHPVSGGGGGGRPPRPPPTRPSGK